MSLSKQTQLLLAAIALIALVYFLVPRPESLSTETAPLDEYSVDTSDMLSKEISTEITTNSTLNSEERNSLLYMREEEKLARDVYLALGKTWGRPIFSNIAKSEETHMNAVLALLEKYDIPDPVQSDTPGVFTQVVFQNLYTELVSRGETSEAAAFEVGAEIEDLDIADLTKALSETQNPAIENVYQNLMKGSRNHLRAFNRQLENLTGKPYRAVHISENQLQSILSSEQEKGPSR
jgi:hypothetical protein